MIVGQGRGFSRFCLATDMRGHRIPRSPVSLLSSRILLGGLRQDNATALRPYRPASTRPSVLSLYFFASNAVMGESHLPLSISFMKSRGSWFSTLIPMLTQL